MEYKEFVRLVEERSGLSREEAADLSRATVETLGDRLSAGEARHLAAELPAPLRESLHISERIERFGLRDMVRRVSRRTGLTVEETRGGVSAVLLTLREAVAGEAFDHAMAQLPSEFEQAASERAAPEQAAPERVTLEQAASERATSWQAAT
ncbi:DUF2267 domain-containing protein [Sphaerimonospora thailandensis]|uniref:DUF2267 domain-containing protein n=1 Tax=Sphaerimonospora thailandensis TaxID=795644 RepID=A0A8J3W1U6_9ACTN|nr:DUF2267 domain-containing protein [Sphaerimonospora thailandensis]GIH72453.1 hypothetical protein Mth01_47060 [Sphaerimonospora thailandensis]